MPNRRSYRTSEPAGRCPKVQAGPLIDWHPSEELIDSYSMNRLPEEQTAAIDEHVFACERCRRLCERTDEIVAGLRLTGYVPQSAAALERASRMFQRNVFIAHGGRFMKHVRLMAEFLVAINWYPVVVKDLPNLGLSIDEKVRRYMKMCHAAVVLATADDEDRSKSRTRPNVDQEMGMLQITPEIGGRIVLMKERSVRLASNYREKLWIEFARERIQDSFIPLAKELHALELHAFAL
jgi:predicted nucleotide-binding protein